MKCPACRKGILLEWKAGVYCSRLYNKNKKSCYFEAGLCNSPAEWEEQVRLGIERCRKLETTK